MLLKGLEKWYQNGDSVTVMLTEQENWHLN